MATAKDSAGRTVSDAMLYNLNPSAIQSSVHMKTLNCDGGSTYEGNINSKIIFTVPHIPGGEYWDASMSRFRCIFRLHVPVPTRETQPNSGQYVLQPRNGKNNAGDIDDDRVPPENVLSLSRIGEDQTAGQYIDCIRFERGCESIIRRLEVKDQSGQLVESLNDYDLIYAITEICQDDQTSRQTRGSFQGEKCYSENHAMGAFLYPPSNRNELVVTGKDKAYRDFELTFSTVSAVVGGPARKAWPMSSFNGLRIELTLNDAAGCLTYTSFPTSSDRIYAGGYNGDPTTNLPVDPEMTIDELKAYVETDNTAMALAYAHRPLDPRFRSRVLPDNIKEQIRYQIIDPVLQMNTIIIPPQIDLQIRAQGQALSPDNRIRMQTTSWQSFSTTIKWDETFLSYVIPIHVASLKSLFFTITPNQNAGDINCDRSQFIMRKLKRYNFKLNGENVLSSDVRVQFPYSEAVAELLRAWSVGPKDGGFPTMLTLDAYGDDVKQVKKILQQPTDAIFAVDMESFSSKSSLMDSGVNVRNSSLQFEASFGTPNDPRDKQEWGERQTINFFCLYDTYVAIDPTTGMVSYEN